MAPELVEEELVEACFGLLHRKDSFIENVAVEPGGGAPAAPLGEGKRSCP